MENISLSKSRWTQKTNIVCFFVCLNQYVMSLIGKSLNIESRWVGVPVVVQQKRIRLVSVKMRVWSLALLSGSGTQYCVSCGVGRRRGSELTLLWLWCRPADVALIQPVAWELPNAMGAALKSKKKKKSKWVVSPGMGEPWGCKFNPWPHSQVKDPAWLWAVVWVANAARIWCCCGCGVGQRL